MPASEGQTFGVVPGDASCWPRPRACLLLSSSVHVSDSSVAKGGTVVFRAGIEMSRFIQPRWS